VPRIVKDLNRGLLTVDPTCRLSAGEALGHEWFTEAGAAACKEDPSPAATLRRCSSSTKSLVDLRRSYFVWNLAECADDEDEDEASPHS